MEEFKEYLLKNNLSDKTIKLYVYAVNSYLKLYSDVKKKSLLNYKCKLIEKFKPKTVNLRLQGLNKYLEFIKKDSLKLKFIKIQQKTFLENVISDADYNFLKNRLKEDGRLQWYFEVRFLAATGARISELLQIKIEHVTKGYYDIYSKGGKVRRIYIPVTLQEEALEWIKNMNKKSGYLFTYKHGKMQTPRYVSHNLKTFAIEYGLNPSVVYPHSFRHRYAKNFLDRYNDIALLADLMGHESIETTRIYLRKTFAEQRKIVDDVVTW